MRHLLAGFLHFAQLFLNEADLLASTFELVGHGGLGLRSNLRTDGCGVFYAVLQGLGDAGEAVLHILRNGFEFSGSGSVRGRDGLGLGDAKLLAAIGAFVGLNLLPLTLLLAACAGLLAAGAAALAGRRMTSATAIPFGPFLALSGWLLFLYADRLTDWLMDGAFGTTLSGWLGGG